LEARKRRKEKHGRQRTGGLNDDIVKFKGYQRILKLSKVLLQTACDDIDVRPLLVVVEIDRVWRCRMKKKGKNRYEERIQEAEVVEVLEAKRVTDLG
jgi:hypothetical protein